MRTSTSTADAASRPAPAPVADPEHEADLGWSLGMLLRAYQDALGHAIGDLPQGYRGYQVLREVVRGDRPSQLALATHLGIDRTVMTYLVDDLVAADLVERHLDADDRRRRRVVATTRGAAVLTDLERRVTHAEQSVLGALDAAERDLFGSLVRRAACAAREIGVERDACDVVQETVERVGASTRA
ncbi:MAG TPA: MarR family winged helix-turn-helix transcriptional regulator [Cellulomonas sp.]